MRPPVHDAPYPLARGPPRDRIPASPLGATIGANLKLAQILDVIEGVLIASEHPDIVEVERYGIATEPWGPTVALSKSKSISGVLVKYTSTATASIWGGVQPGEIAIPMPDEMPPIGRRSPRLAIFVAQLLDVARPAVFSSWRLAGFPGIGLDHEQGKLPSGVVVVCADGTEMILRVTSTGPTAGREPEEDPFPEYQIPEGVKQWHLRVNAQSAEPE